MARNHDEISFRDMDQKFLLVKDIDMKTRMVIEKSGFRIRQDDNAMLFGYIDQQAGLSFELLCAACVYDDEEVSLEPASKTTSFKFRYGSFQGDMVPFTNLSLLIPFHDRAQMIKNGYGASRGCTEGHGIRRINGCRIP